MARIVLRAISRRSHHDLDIVVTGTSKPGRGRPRASWNDIVDRVLLANPGKLEARVADAAQFYRVSRATVWSALRKCRIVGDGVLQR